MGFGNADNQSLSGAGGQPIPPKQPSRAPFQWVVFFARQAQEKTFFLGGAGPIDADRTWARGAADLGYYKVMLSI